MMGWSPSLILRLSSFSKSEGVSKLSSLSSHHRRTTHATALAIGLHPTVLGAPLASPFSSPQPRPQQQQQSPIFRYKHSARQLNLKLINHPSVYRRRRREERQQQILQLLEEDEQGDEQGPGDNNKKVSPEEEVHVPVLIGTISRFHKATIRAKPNSVPWFTPTFLPNGWSAPPPSLPATTTATTSISDNAVQTSSPTLPFSIHRTIYKKNYQSIGFLPVYSVYGRNDGTKVTTRIKKIQGDIQEFVREVQAVLYQEFKSQQQEKQQSSFSSSSSSKLHPWLVENLPPPLIRIPPIRIRAQGTIVEVDGNHVRTIKTWLAGLGF